VGRSEGGERRLGGWRSHVLFTAATAPHPPPPPTTCHSPKPLLCMALSGLCLPTDGYSGTVRLVLRLRGLAWAWPPSANGVSLLGPGFFGISSQASPLPRRREGNNSALASFSEERRPAVRSTPRSVAMVSRIAKNFQDYFVNVVAKNSAPACIPTACALPRPAVRGLRR
jgi:hypothetical protein